MNNKPLSVIVFVLFFVGADISLQAEDNLKFVDLFNGKDLTGWIDVTTLKKTWSVKDGELICSGHPIGVMRSEKQYENFILQIEWKHMEAGGNSGIFVWSEGKTKNGRPLPKGMEVQMLELDWVKKHPDIKQVETYVSGELFGAGGMTSIPDNPNPRKGRSHSLEMRCKGKGEWNKYIVVCVDGVVKLSVNGKMVNGVRNASTKKGYLCLESEGSEIHFRDIRIMELPAGITSKKQTAEIVNKN
ncbi:conserved hypothetical protein-putative membrane lipoprotein [hydrothermal vent metagenome]|uniref:3-keto-alpha-glucoside-1,2-lyase/3-keto-2-hydroxy-glucal hydratase domain-containing protein n=1 Tax=hydrothermal vent metagenome TaxID=652676 RepID=A0A3B1DU10_9ZZZZ